MITYRRLLGPALLLGTVALGVVALAFGGIASASSSRPSAGGIVGRVGTAHGAASRALRLRPQIVRRQNAGSQTFMDATADSGSVADVTSVAVSNDDAGMISIKVTTAAPLGPTDALFVFIDSDKNSSTGAPPAGRDYLWFATPIGGPLLAWNGSDFVLQPGKGSVVPSGNVVEFSINRADLGNTSGFDFFVASANLDGDGTLGDEAPDAGSYVYDLSFAQCANGKDDDGDGKIDSQDPGCSSSTDQNEADDPVHVKLGPATIVPLHPKAGGSAVVSAAATRVETGQALDSGSVRCAARVTGGAALRGAGALVSGRAQCTFRSPKTAKGRMVRGQISVTYQSVSATTSFAFRTAT